MKHPEKVINMFWFKLPNNEENFGDVLGPYLVGALSGKMIRYVPIVDSPINSMISFLKGILKKKYGLKDLPSIWRALTVKRVLVSVGSVISFVKHSKADVWGAGIIHKKDKTCNASFFAVRGKYTQERLEELGYTSPDIIGDPALLLPLVFNPTVTKQYKIGVIPHYIHYEEFYARYSNKNVLIINLKNSIEEVVKAIKSCECTISTSLHGLIVSHCYDVPSLWYEVKGSKKLSGDNIKFFDYFSSVNIKEYYPYVLENLNVEEIVEQVKTHPDLSTIQTDLRLIQQKLLGAAPFRVLKKYTETE